MRRSFPAGGRLRALAVLLLAVGVVAGGLLAGPTALAQSSAPAAGGPAAAGEVAVGVIIDTTNPRSMQLAREAGFTHAKMIVQWSRLEPKRGRYTFRETSENDLDNIMKAARAEGMKLVLRVDGTPDWAGGAPARASLDAVEAFYAAMAAHAKGTVVAYEILNEPNLPFEWGGPPDPAGYTALLKAAYRGVKEGDPSALVVGGGVSPSTGGAGGTIEDVDFLRGMYAAGARGAMDALSVHNYGGNHAPERDPVDCGICFRRAEVYRQVMMEQGDAATPVWATEFGWLLDPGRDMGQYDWMRVSAEQQAEYVVRAYRYAQQWPWMTGLLLSNLDASTSPYHTGPQDGMPWFAILNKDHSPRPAWHAMRAWREQERERARAGAASRPRPSASPQPLPPPPSTDGAGAGPTGASAPADQPPAAGSPVGADAPPLAPAIPEPASVAAAPAGSAAPGSGDPAAPSAMNVPSGADAPAEPAGPSTPAAPGAGASASAPSPAAPPSNGPVPAAPVANSPVPAVSAATALRLRVVKTDGTGVHLRARPRADAASLAVLPEGTTVEVVGEDAVAGGRTWRNVRTARGQTGWVAAQYLAP